VWSPRGKGIFTAAGDPEAVVWRGNTVAPGTGAVDGRKGSPRRAGRWRLAMEKRVRRERAKNKNMALALCS
jgi:hypothetical protein